MNEGPRRPRRRRPRPQAGARRSARHWTEYLPWIALGVFAVAVAVVITLISMWLAPAGRPVTVPPFIGMPFNQAEALASSSHVGLRVVAHRNDFHAPKDVIIGQLPSAGEKVREGRVIDIILSDGVPLVSVPNVSNMSLRDAKLTLSNAHLTIGTVTQTKNLDIIAGQVLNQRPDPFTQVPAGSAVDIQVASGRPQMYAPNFVGLQLTVAKKAASDAHIALGTFTAMPLTEGAKPKGTIVGQDPVPGTALGAKQKIALQVSSGGPESPTPLPTPVQDQSSPAESASLSPSPLPSPSPILPSPAGERTMRVSIALPKSDTPKPVRVVLQDAAGSHTVFDQVTSGGIVLTVDLTVKGSGTLETYVDGKLVTSTPL
ncbi:MAG: PASTA domain-containing protein [Candidatus Eremiobacteraeota bacterium]|nr:PASTA domain-containing protein [Candidatus Eremiobacteraeota bacterium]MBV8264369.1 PASTA domain-containing protein [Candidatus Eremiobacteraeota bacterium]